MVKDYTSIYNMVQEAGKLKTEAEELLEKAQDACNHPATRHLIVPHKDEYGGLPSTKQYFCIICGKAM